MNITVRQIEFQIAGNTVCGWIYTPGERCKAAVQIVHGMAEHMGRYHEFMRFLAQNGYAACGIDQIGHGRTAEGKQYGFFAERDGWKLLLDCQHKFNKIIRSELPGTPVVLFGHSMGSFVSRVYAAKYPQSINALLLSGTGRIGMKLELAIQLANRSAEKNGARYVDAFIDNMIFGSYNKRFLRDKHKYAWLSSDPEEVRTYAADPACGIKFTASAFRDLFILIRKSDEKICYEAYAPETPLLMISGALDPLGDEGKGPREVCERYIKAGVDDAELRLYENGRHEMLFERNRHQVYEDILEWLDDYFAGDLDD